MSRKIWTVWEDGEEGNPGYSFTTPELAHAHAEQLEAVHGWKYRVEEDEVLDRLPQRVEFHSRQGRVDPAGIVQHGQPTTYEYWDSAPPQEVHLDARNHRHNGVTVTVWHWDPVEAQRIYAEQVAALVAELWGMKPRSSVRRGPAT